MTWYYLFTETPLIFFPALGFALLVVPIGFTGLLAMFRILGFIIHLFDFCDAFDGPCRRCVKKDSHKPFDLKKALKKVKFKE